jgi:hypothetical protein
MSGDLYLLRMLTGQTPASTCPGTAHNACGVHISGTIPPVKLYDDLLSMCIRCVCIKLTA